MPQPTVHSPQALVHVVMEWVEGTPLYEWGRAQQRTSRQVLQLLAQLARALEMAHAADSLHRDVKGENVLVTPEGRAVLLDWGCGTYEGAKALTDTRLPPGTVSYRTPEALRWGWAHQETAEAYKAGPPDDVYALGVTAYRLCTGLYPPVPDEGSGPQRRLLPPRELATVSAHLERQLLAMLSQDRCSRPSAATLAIGFSAAAQEKDASRPILPTRAAAKTQVASPPRPSRDSVAPGWPSAVGVVLVGVLGGLVAIKVRPAARPDPGDSFVEEQRHAVSREVPDAGVGDEGLLSLQEAARAVVPLIPTVGVPIPPKPPDGQKKPPCAPGQVAVNGACWAGPLKGQEAPCKPGLFDYEGECYIPAYDAPRKPTSEDPQ